MVPTRHEHSIPVIYLITCKVNGKLYVGSAKNFCQRYHQYRTPGLREDRLIVRAIRKHGFGQFEFSILERVIDTTQLVAREQHYLDALDCLRPNGYNVCPVAGSTLGVSVTPECKLKISRANSGKRGRAVVQLDCRTGLLIEEYTSVGLASKATGISVSSISEVCRREKVSAKGYQWCFKDNYDPNTYIVRQHKHRGGPQGTVKPVLQLDLEGKVMCMWDNCLLAAASLGLRDWRIRHVCHGKLDTAGSYRWSFVTDPILIAEVNARLKAKWKDDNATRIS